MNARRTGDDLFEDTRMSFGEHLEELRVCLIRSLVGIGVGCVMGFIFADQIVSFLQSPLEKALRSFGMGQATLQYEQRYGYFAPGLKKAIEKDGLAPRTIYIEPGKLVQAIQNLNPGVLAEIDLTPFRFLRDHLDVDHMQEICQRLVEPDQAPSESQPMVTAIRDSLNADQLNVVRQIAAADTVGSTDQAQLLTILNSIINDSRVHQSDAFASWMTAPEWRFWHWFDAPDPNPFERMKSKLDNESDADLNRQLNRLLVARTFADLMPLPEIDLFPLEIWESLSITTQALSPQEGFMIWLKAGLVAGLVLAGPWVFFQIWIFIAKGLYPHEQKYVYLYLPISVGLFVAGVCLAFFFVFEPVLGFLFTFNASMGINPQPRIGEWLSFVLFLPLGFGVAFQLPLVMLFVNRIGLVAIKTYLDKWRIAILVISILSMVLTPSDPISMIMLGVPLTLLYFLGIGLCRWMPSPKNPFGEVDDL